MSLNESEQKISGEDLYNKGLDLLDKYGLHFAENHEYGRFNSVLQRKGYSRAGYFDISSGSKSVGAPLTLRLLVDTYFDSWGRMIRYGINSTEDITVVKRWVYDEPFWAGLGRFILRKKPAETASAEEISKLYGMFNHSEPTEDIKQRRYRQDVEAREFEDKLRRQLFPETSLNYRGLSSRVLRSWSKTPPRVNKPSKAPKIVLDNSDEFKDRNWLIKSLGNPDAFEQIPEVYNLTIDELNLSTRSYNSFKRSNVRLVGQILQMTAGELLSVRIFGRKSLNELADKLVPLCFQSAE